ncbi:HPr-rel-A system PqqD family peptide chaperone [Sphingomonas solaris]|uniref:HPr-rel-A system PqqD family peptide chaperone n=1 Tax=Alterirhizorhabdus solaris TaxID=2529389 RepID=A0A558R0U6_9SPHN|nr:HPr-rel-A system PqqD family peptide chaperone [Sphingomonas solaris]TVV73000.1 HPr-rel-A system PqqD family peptide chaperone [Sphingomonas solaris]
MPVYRVDPPACRLSVEAEGMTLLYHRPSGITHVLLPPAPEILTALADGPADPATLAARLAVSHAIGDGDGEDAAAVIAARLGELAAVGLVAVAPGIGGRVAG